MPENTFFALCLRIGLALSFLLTTVLAEDPYKVFQWKFSSDTLSTSLATCVSLPITVQPFNVTNVTGSSGIPPYYMQAFAIGGIPTSTLIGTDNKTLSWQPTHPPGTKLLLSVVDSMGSAGGVPPSLYTVIAGQSTQCVNNDDPTDFTVTANVTDELTTCQPWGLRIRGGAPPYNVTFAAINSPIITNVTMPFGDDVFTYINRADPNNQLIAAISDLTGRWAKGTPIVTTRGSANYSCVGLVSSSGNSTNVNQNQTPRSNKKTAIIVGVVVPIVALLLLGAAFAWWHRRRRQRRQQLIEPDVLPRQFEETGGQVLSITGLSGSTSPSSKALVFGEYPHARSMSASSTAGMSSTYLSSSGSPQDDPTSQLEPNRRSPSSGRPGFSTFPSAPVRRSAKGAEAGSPDIENGAVDEEVVIQHRDAGAVRELPPPYADRGGSGPSS